jgi:hypothetical protein
VCEGYGVWTEPGSWNRNGPLARTVVPTISRLESKLVNTSPLVNLSGFKGIEEQGYFDWFKRCTVPKLPGAFPSAFWEVFLLQAGASEPAVLHAILALGSAHKRKVLYSGLETVEVPPDLQEQFMLRHYSKAIINLRPHLTYNNRASARVALVTCLVFISLEYIRGHYRAGQIHLHNGLKLLQEVEAKEARDADRAIIIMNPKPESIDDWVIDSYARLQAQGDFFGKRSRALRFVLQDSPLSDKIAFFESAAQARQLIERLIDELIYLKDRYAMHVVYSENDYKFDTDARTMQELHTKRQFLRDELAIWVRRCRPPLQRPFSKKLSIENIAYKLLGIYHDAAKIMVSCIPHLHNESIFDSQTASFLSIVNQAIEINQLVNSGQSLHDFPGRNEMSSSITDLGWIPPLFFTALKCRHHRIRMQAIKLLSYALHKEGVWDAKLSVSLAREVVELEEGTFYDGYDEVEDFHSPIMSLEEKDLTLPLLPHSDRWEDVDVVLPEADKGKFIITLRRQCGDGSWEMLRREYNARLRAWVGGSVERLSDDEWEAWRARESIL